jgi:hypothetical protein
MVLNVTFSPVIFRILIPPPSDFICMNISNSHTILNHFFSIKLFKGNNKKKEGCMMARRNKLLVPESRPAMDKLKNKVVTEKGYQTNGDPNQAKFEVAADLGIPLKKGYNGELTSKQAGKIGGNIGGSMVKEMVKMAQQNMGQGNK